MGMAAEAVEKMAALKEAAATGVWKAAMSVTVARLAPRSVMAGRAKDTKGKVYRVQFCQVHAFVKRNFCHHGSCADHESQSNHPA